MKIKLSLVGVFGIGLVFGTFVLGCASVKDLTSYNIVEDIGGLDGLANCQYFVSTDITLRHV
ncbi:MAG: hypothetical protein LBK73_15985 [Treponema sp.]|nr:hypothetical protein [Treponema sp.]